MRPIAADVAQRGLSVCPFYLSVSVSVLGTSLVSCVKMAEPIEMLLRRQTHVSQRNHELVSNGSRSDESICHCEGWQDGDAFSCQITLDTCYYLFGKSCTEFCRRPFCHPISRIREVKKTQSADPNQWANIIHSSLDSGESVHLCQLCDASTYPKKTFYFKNQFLQAWCICR